MNATTHSSQPLPKKDLRKAAVLIATLDTRSADALLDKMPPESASLVRQMIMDLDDISPDEQNAVIREFMRAGGQATQIEEDGVELSLGSSRDDRAEEFPSPAGVSIEPTARPFAFLREVRASALVRHLERQHPQLIAVVTAHLPPPQAAELVKQLPPRTQADVLRRVAELDLADQEVLADLERELERLLADELRANRNRQAGLATLTTILDAAGEGKRELWHNLSQHHQDLAARIPERADLKRGTTRAVPVADSEGTSTPARPATRSSDFSPPRAKPSVQSPVSASARRDNAASGAMSSGVMPENGEPRGPQLAFEQLVALKDEDWAELIREAEPAVVLLALTGASEAMLQRVTRRLPRREAQALRTRLQQTGPLRLSDIEHAQQRLAQLAGRLIARGKIAWTERRSFAAAA